MKPTTSTINRHPFNLIEIILALVIILVGVVSIMALFPVGQEATRSAVGRSSAGDAGDQFLRYFSSKLKSRWALVNTVPISKPDADAEANANWQSIDMSGVFTGTHNQVQGVQFFYNDEDNDSKFDYKIVPPADLSRDESGLFLISQRTTEHIEDFSGVIRVWKSATTHPTYESSTNSWSAYSSVPPDGGIKLNIEVSWPSGLPYDRREKATYSMDVFRPNETQLQEANGAFRIAEAGQLEVTYHGSDAGWNSALWMTEPETVEIFDSNQKTDQNLVWTTEYKPGTEFNFNITTTAGCCGYGTYNHYAWAPSPAECECTCRTIKGSLNINPNNSPDNEFTLTKKDGGTITRDDLHAQSPTDGNGVYWSGSATYIRVKPKGNGNQNTMLIDGVVYPLENKYTYVFDNTDMQVTVYNDHIKNGKAMGHWWLSMDADCAKIRQEGEAHDRMCPRHPSNLGTVLNGTVPYFDNPPTAFNGAYDLLTGNPYCMVTDLQPGREWLLRFEDLPGAAHPDWDYNDVVISVKLIVDDGVSESLTSVSVSGTVTLNMEDDWRVALVKANGTMLTDAELRDGAGGYDGSAISLWFRPRGDGSQTITVDGASTSFDNEQMISICADAKNMTVKIYQSGSTWKADFTATDAFFTVLD